MPARREQVVPDRGIASQRDLLLEGSPRSGSSSASPVVQDRSAPAAPLSTPQDALRAVVAEKRQVGSLIREVRILPEHDCHDRCAFGKSTCKPGSGGWHGIGSRRISWSVADIGKGAVDFTLSTAIYTENALVRGGARLAALAARWEPLGPLNIHYADPPDCLRELGWGPEACDLIDGPCWSDVTYLSADDGYESFVLGGNEGVWSWLAETRLPDALNVSTEASK